MLRELASTSLIVLLLNTLPWAQAQTVSPGPSHDCSQQTFYVGDLACHNDLHNCCGPTETCCGSGCCGFDQVCVFGGTPQETCCPIGDPDNCGYDPFPVSGHGGSCPTTNAQIPCSGIDSSWYCSSECTCNVSVDGGCNCFTSCDDSSSPSSSASLSVAPVTKSSPPESSPTDKTVASEDATTSSPTVIASSEDSTPSTEEAASPTELSSFTSRLSISTDVEFTIQTQTSVSTNIGGIASASGSASASDNGSGSGSGGTSGSGSDSGSSSGSTSGSPTGGSPGPATASQANAAGKARIISYGPFIIGAMGWVLPNII